MYNINCIGDSITEHWGDISGYLDPLVFTCVNAGVGGNLARDVLARINTAVNPAITNKCAILVGINDIVGGANFGGDYQYLISPPVSVFDQMKSVYENLISRNVTPYPCTLPPVANLGQVYPFALGSYTVAQVNALIVTLNTSIKTYCTDNHLTVIDYYPYFADGSGNGKSILYAGEGLHPNTFGNGVMLSVLAQTISGSSQLACYNVLTNMPVASNESVVSFRQVINGVSQATNRNLLVGSPGYTGPNMTTAQLIAVARQQLATAG